MDRLGGVSTRRALILLGAFIVVGGFVLALFSNFVLGNYGSFGAASQGVADVIARGGATNVFPFTSNVAGSYYGSQPPQTQVIGTSTVTMSTTTQGYYHGNANYTSQGSPSGTLGTGSMLEFSTDLTIQSTSPQATASQVVAMAYSVGGYVAYQSTSTSAAYLVIRVPASQYQQTVSRVEALGTLVTTVSNSNDVRVQYTDLNATLASLKTEQGALLRLLNKSTSVNTTLSIESQLQGVDQQINDIQSQILQTRTLVDYSTINVTITQNIPLAMTLKAAPGNGTSPLSVTFDAIVKGGTQPYVVNFNFGDGTGDQGQILIHTYYQSGDFKVTVTATDQNGTVVIKAANVHVDAAPGQGAVASFLGTVSNLFVSVIEGIVEVAVVVLPLAAVGAVVILPFRRRTKPQKDYKQSQ